LHRTGNGPVQIDLECSLASDWVDLGGPGQRCCWPLNADPLAGVGNVEEVRDVVAEGSRVALRFTVSGTQSGQWGILPPIGKRVEFGEVVILDLRDGRVVRQRGVTDNLTALRQLGILPAPPASCRMTHAARRRVCDRQWCVRA
jgi:hypothetical protein